MKIGIYSPYLDTSGGGERYMLTIGEILSKNHQVDVFLDSHLQILDTKEVIKRNSRLLDLDLSKIDFIKAPFGKGSNFLQRLTFLKKYDVLFYLTDGSIFYSSAKRNILHIQSPINVRNNSLWKKIKKSSWDLIIYNSQFTKNSCEGLWKIKGEVIYPPVDVSSFKPNIKKKQILTVGRFFGFLKDKQHQLMIESFKKMCDSGKIKDWSFHLAGGAGEGDMFYLKELKKISEGYPIYFYPNLEFKKLVNLYSESAIYWHASGFGETDSTKMEHFGITTVEAMASGCVPVVINLGGQKEIVENGVNGFLWNTLNELEEKTINLINDEDIRKKMTAFGLRSSSKFSREIFSQKINNII